MSQTKDALLKSYNTRLKEDVKSMLENFEGNALLRKQKSSGSKEPIYFRNHKNGKRRERKWPAN